MIYARVVIEHGGYLLWMELSAKEWIILTLDTGCEGSMLTFWFVADRSEFVHGSQSIIRNKLYRVHSPLMTIVCHSLSFKLKCLVL